ncbi:MAG: hypothetical protein IJO54_05535 [Oscillospiraceae bacterium]|nr:hypothetical protein [Oscillospiraceae bacterium]
MKGLKHNVIEINDTQNDNIDRILVFLKPQASDVAVMTTRAEAAKILQELEVRNAGGLSAAKKFWICAGAAAAVLIVALLLIL